MILAAGLGQGRICRKLKSGSWSIKWTGRIGNPSAVQHPFSV